MSIIGEKTKYYILGYEHSPATVIEDNPEYAKYDGLGNSISQIIKDTKKPVRFCLDKDYEGDIAPFYFGNCLLMSDLIVESLNNCGVKNIETIKAEIENPWTKEVMTNYSIVNIVGLVSCLKSNTQKKKVGEPIVEGDETNILFENVYIDETKALASNLDIFRMKEGNNPIIVSEKIMECLQKAHIDMTYYGGGVYSA